MLLTRLSSEETEGNTGLGVLRNSLASTDAAALALDK